MLSNTIKSFRSLTPLASRSMASGSQGGQPKRIVVTGAAGQISYSILFRLARYIKSLEINT